MCTKFSIAECIKSSSSSLFTEWGDENMSVVYGIFIFSDTDYTVTLFTIHPPISKYFNSSSLFHFMLCCLSMRNEFLQKQHLRRSEYFFIFHLLLIHTHIKSIGNLPFFTSASIFFWWGMELEWIRFFHYFYTRWIQRVTKISTMQTEIKK